MDVAPPRRRPPLRKLRVALIATGAVVVALLLAWMPGRANVSDTCGVCGSVADSTAVGLFWDDDPFVAISIAGDEVASPSFADSLAPRGHVHQWQTLRSTPKRFVADLFVRHTHCPSTPHCLHSEWALKFNWTPQFRSRLAALIDAKSWTLEEVEDALLWCDDVGCPFSRHDLPQEVADRRANAHRKLRRFHSEFRSQAR